MEFRESKRGYTRVLRIRESSLQMSDEAVLTGILVLACFQPIFDIREVWIPVKKIVIDMSHVRYINIEILSAFIIMRKWAELLNIQLIVCSLQPRVRQTFGRAQLEQQITLAETLEAALEL